MPGSVLGPRAPRGVLLGTRGDRIAQRVLGPEATRTTSSSRRTTRSERDRPSPGIAIGIAREHLRLAAVVIGGGFGLAAFDLVPAARRAVLREALAPAGQELRSCGPSSARRLG